MNRRNFFKWLGIGTAAVAVAPYALLNGEPVCVAADSPLGVSLLAGGTLGEYADYSNFSSFALTEAIDKAVAQAAAELGVAAGRGISALHETASYDPRAFGRI